MDRPRLGVPAALALAVAAGLLLGARGYGPHRDELYFLACGHHLAWAYPDQGPLVPLIAWAMDGLAPGSLTVLRTPSAFMAGGTVLVTALIAFELGGGARAQRIAAACAAVASIVLITGHLLSTTTVDLFAWTVLTWLVARILRTGDGRLWPAAGVVAGLALLNKPLIAFFVMALLAGVLLTGPRPLLRDRRLAIGVVIALVLWSPWLVWQARHGWPQLDVSSAIARGDSGSSQPRWALLPFQFLLVSPVLAPVWIAGLAALWRRPALRPFRLFAVAWVVLVLVFLVTGGKPYYLAGLFPVLLGAGAIEVDGWLARTAGRARAVALWGAVGLSAIVSACLALPVLPAGDAGIVVAMNGDRGEEIGWPALTRTVAVVVRATPGTPVIFTQNYGEAGALRRYGPGFGLPRAYSGHNAFAEWGPPPDRAGPVVVVGVSRRVLRAAFRGCARAARIDNPAGIDNDERGVAVSRCAGTRLPWSQEWSRLRHLG